MSTEKPRFSVTFTEDSFEKIQKYKEESEYLMTLVNFDELQEEAEEWAERQREKDGF